MSQTRCALLNVVSFSFVGHAETLADDMRGVLKSIAPDSHSQDLSAQFNRTNASPDESIYTERLAKAVYQRYRADFDNFKYDPAGWKFI